MNKLKKWIVLPLEEYFSKSNNKITNENVSIPPNDTNNINNNQQNNIDIKDIYSSIEELKGLFYRNPINYYSTVDHMTNTSNSKTPQKPILYENVIKDPEQKDIKKLHLKTKKPLDLYKRLKSDKNKNIYKTPTNSKKAIRRHVLDKFQNNIDKIRHKNKNIYKTPTKEIKRLIPKQSQNNIDKTYWPSLVKSINEEYGDDQEWEDYKPERKSPKENKNYRRTPETKNITQENNDETGSGENDQEEEEFQDMEV